METFHIQLCNLPPLPTCPLHSGNFGYFLVLIKTKACISPCLSFLDFMGTFFDLNPGQCSWKLIRERIRKTQCNSSAGKQLKSEPLLMVLAAVEVTRYRGKNGTRSWPNRLGTTSRTSHQAGEEMCLPQLHPQGWEWPPIPYVVSHLWLESYSYVW